MPNTSNDFLLLKYQLNENYHDSKEKSGWIAITLYYSLSISLFSFLFNVQLKNMDMIYYSFFYLVVTGVTFVFISKQFYRKAESVILTYCYNVLFKNATCFEDEYFVKKEYTWEKLIGLYNMEIPLFIIAIILYCICQYRIIERLRIFDLQVYNFTCIVYLFFGIPLLLSLILIYLSLDVKEIQKLFSKDNYDLIK